MKVLQSLYSSFCLATNNKFRSKCVILQVTKTILLYTGGFHLLDILVRPQNFLNCWPHVLQLLKHVIKYCEKVYERSSKNLFWCIKNSDEILDKLKARDFNATSLSTYDFSNLYTTLPHNLIKDKLIDLIERTLNRECCPYFACNDRNAFFASENPKKYHAWSFQNVCDALTFFVGQHFYSIWHQIV